MNSPPSIFQQPPESVPPVTLDGPSQFESTETGGDSWEQAKSARLPWIHSRPSTTSEELDRAGNPGPAHSANQSEVAPGVSNVRLQSLSEQPRVTDSAQQKWKWQKKPEKSVVEGKGDNIQFKRPKLAASGARGAPPEHSYTAPILRKRSLLSDPSPPQLRAKAPRLSKDDPDLRGAFHHVDYANLKSSVRHPLTLQPGPVSPLFFSNTPGKRPPLAPRFSSSEAGAFLLDNVAMEDNGSGGAVKTVKMARGSVGQMSPPSVGGGSLRTASFSGRPTPVRRTPSTPTSDEPAAREPLSSGLQSLSQVGVLELLDQDERPTFIVDLSYKTNFQPGALHISFANNALRSIPGLIDSIRGRGSGDKPAFSPTPSFPVFKSWVTSFVNDHEAMDVPLPTYSYSGLTWKASAMKKRFRVISGSIMQEPLPMHLSAVVTPGASATSQARAKQISYEEPSDYFGQAQLPPLHESSHENDSSTGGSIPSQSPLDQRKQTIVQQQPDLQEATNPVNAMTEQFKRNGKSEPTVTAVSTTSYGGEISPLGRRPNEALLRAAAAGGVDWFGPPRDMNSYSDGAQLSESSFGARGATTQYYFDWTRLPVTPSLPRHIQFARSVDWASTPLGPIESWSGHLRATSCLIMASPHPAAMYWGDDYVAIYNEPYILLAGQKHPQLMGMPYAVAWSEIWDSVKDSFQQARLTGQSTMKDDDKLFLNRNGYLEETYFSWSIIPLVGDDGTVVGLYNPAFEKTRRKIAERRMLTLREVGEKTAAAREVKSFWGAVLKALEYNEYDTPFVLLYSVTDEDNSDGSSIHSNSIFGAKQVTLEGTLPELSADHPAAPAVIDLKSGNEGFAPVFREAMMNDKHILLETANGTLDEDLLGDMDWRGFNEKPRAAVVSPIHPTTGESIIGFLVMGINPRRPYDDDYNLFVTLLTRQLATSMASVVLFEEEIRRGQRAAKLAALDRIELSEQLAARTQEAIESETKFTRMAEFAPVGIFIANKEGSITFTNSVFHSLTHLPKNASGENWMELVKEEDKHILEQLWDDVVHKGMSRTAEIRFKGTWKGSSGVEGEIWVLCSAFPEKYPDGSLKSIFGSLTDISQQKWVEGFQIKRTEEAFELKRQQSNFIDMTSHEMRNPLSAILQSADEIVGSLIEFKNGNDADKIPLDLIESNIDAAQTISLCANHQTRIVSDVLTLSKLDSALLLVTPVDVQPRVIMQQAMKMFEGELLTADIQLNFNMDKSIDEYNVDWVRLDPSRLLQVLINLMTNAIKFTTPEARRIITIELAAHHEPPSKQNDSCVDYIPRSAKRSDSIEGPDWGDGELIYLSFAVRDTGKGLTDDEKKLLFLRFSQASPKTHVQYGGSGLGLFISRELVELQGGEIGVSSEAGKGSTFAFYVRARKSKGPEGDADNSNMPIPTVAALPGHAAALRRPSVTQRVSAAKTTANAATSSLSTTAALAATAASASSGYIASPATAQKLPSSSANSLGKPAQAAKKTTELSYLKVLIVEDNLVNQKVLAKQLRNIGCIVAVANHGEEALAYLRRTKYWKGKGGKGVETTNKEKGKGGENGVAEEEPFELSVILMDLEMPVMDGLTCTRRIREMEREGELDGHSPIIAVSANARSAHIESAIEAGMDDVVSKPFRIPELVPKIEQLTEKYRGGKSESIVEEA